ncbi:hypothetical protein C8J57DRAFT_317713 [Mycena rebaudengoi]|nr:hypothetical protein C8J57DRAFT_317713 [Mycena rebaudengoi]
MYPKKSHRDDPRARRANYHLATPSTNDDQRGVGYTIPTNKLLYSHSPILQSPIHPHSLELNTNVSTRYPESSQRTQIGSIDFAPTHDTPEAVLSAHKNCEHVSYTAEMTASGSCYSSAPIPSDRPPPSNQPPFFYNPPPFPYSSSSANLNLDSGPYPLSGYPSHLRPFDTGSSGLLYSRECGDLNYQKQRQNGSDFIPIVPNFSESTVDYPFRAENSSVLGSSERSVRLSPDSPESISEISLSPGPTTGVLPQVAATARP